MEIKIGADPELFVVQPDGSFLSGHDLIPGTKAAPHPVNGGAIQVDGVALEFNITPSSTKTQFLDNLTKVVAQMSDIAALKAKGLDIVAVPVATFKPDYFDKLPLSAKELGCTPDFNAYTGKENPRPETNKPFRTGSGHVHIGWTAEQDPMAVDHFEMCRTLVQELDLSLFLPSVLWDADEQRRTLYGAPGAFRPKPYGVEYRVLSNKWLSHDSLKSYVFDMTMWTVEYVSSGKKISDTFKLTDVTPFDAVLALEDLGAPTFPYEAVDEKTPPEFWDYTQGAA